uniref:Small ribosomal subunit protein uS7 n=1 Tax=Capra hircus TaxID=9925 RepID=A0A8C2PER8_CAPHI
MGTWRMTEWETAAPAVAETPDIKLFGKWSTDDVQINDISLQDYIAVKEKYAKYLPHSAGRYAAKRFRKAQCPIVERLTNSMMMHGRNNGKKLMTVRIVKHAFEIIHLLTGENPLQVLVNAIINSGPREDSTRIGRAGTVRRQAVDVSPLRRVNQAIWLLCTGAREAAFRNIKTIAECLADELINAAKGSSNSYAIKKKDAPRELGESCRVCLSEKPCLWGTSGWAFPASLGLLQSQAARREGAPCGSPECSEACPPGSAGQRQQGGLAAQTPFRCSGWPSGSSTTSLLRPERGPSGARQVEAAPRKTQPWFLTGTLTLERRPVCAASVAGPSVTLLN